MGRRSRGVGPRNDALLRMCQCGARTLTSGACLSLMNGGGRRSRSCVLESPREREEEKVRGDRKEALRWLLDIELGGNGRGV